MYMSTAMSNVISLLFQVSARVTKKKHFNLLLFTYNIARQKPESHKDHARVIDWPKSDLVTLALQYSSISHCTDNCTTDRNANQK